MVLSLNTMPNSYDDTIWDQIQTNLARLNSNYEKRSKMLAEIQATCTKICATLQSHQRLQQPPIFQFQAKSNSEVPLLSNNSTKLAAENAIITDLRFWNSDPKYQSAEVEYTTAKASESVRNPEIIEEVHIKGEEGDSSDFKFTVQPQQQTKSTEVADWAIIQHSSLSICNYYDAVPPFQQQQQTSCLNSTLIDAENEEEATDLAEVAKLAFNFEFQPVESTAISVQAGFQNSILELQSNLPLIPEHTREEHLDLHLAHLEETAPAEEEVVVQGGGSAAQELNRPPPKPPYLFTQAAVGPATATGAGETEVLPRASDAVTKVEGNDIVHEGGGWIQSGKDCGASGSADVLRCGVVATRGALRTTNSRVEEALSSDGNPRRGWLRHASPLVAKPPPLTAAVFPWDRGGERHSDDLQWRAAISVSGKENATTNRGDGRWRRQDGSWTAVSPCNSTTAGDVWVGVEAAASFLLFPSTRNEREGRVLLPVRGLGLPHECAAQTQLRQNGPITTKNYYCDQLMDPIIFKQWDPGG
ncbi:uncharacterized protein DS421_19g649600 [Arachis hypogaea]|uniref:Uncharacterized protein n=1 Tax=Arachis hypogaea TaxID=3818 RepID=A0A6B9V759_ARAHY|nr:uncharacterized protein DS421_19g649600 [Arachis hypogaea]